MTRKARAEARRPPVFPACRSKTGCAGSPAAALGGRPGGGVSLRGLTTAAAQPQSAARNAPTSRAPPVADLQRTLDEMELSLDLCAEMCPHCRKDSQGSPLPKPSSASNVVSRSPRSDK